MGGMYLVISSTGSLQRLTRHFDGLIRDAEINAHEAADFVKSLRLG
jgi:hypothetical protein